MTLAATAAVAEAVALTVEAAVAATAPAVQARRPVARRGKVRVRALHVALARVRGARHRSGVTLTLVRLPISRHNGCRPYGDFELENFTGICYGSNIKIRRLA